MRPGRALHRPNAMVRRSPYLGSALASFATHALAVAAILLAMGAHVRSPARSQSQPPSDRFRMVYLIDPRPDGGGGGGGDKTQEPPRQAHAPGTNLRTVLAARPASIDRPGDATPDPPIPQPTIAVQPLGEVLEKLVPGATEVSVSLSLGPGSDGVGSGRRGGAGPGDGIGEGPGFGGNRGGRWPGPGNGVTAPRLVRQVRPQYTADAMNARIQGTIQLECVVQSDGTIGDVRVLRSLDRTFGLDREAIAAARQWRFYPGMRQGEPVDTLVTIELMFSLR
jgi:periplasmic protein TonB